MTMNANKSPAQTRILGYVLAKECTPEEVQLVSGGGDTSATDCPSPPWTSKGEWTVPDECK